MVDLKVNNTMGRWIISEIIYLYLLLFAIFSYPFMLLFFSNSSKKLFHI